jgi:hypothetical protein
VQTLIIAKEVSVWSESYDLNHIYLLNDSMTKVYGYIRNRDLKPTLFGGPRDFNTRYRKFEVLERIKEEDRVEVKGSKGDIYYVTEDDGQYKCTCVGFKYHGTCKHIDKVKNGEIA